MKESGYHALINEWKQGQQEIFLNTDWSRTKAYAYGLNSLYINERGREGEGIVSPGAEKESLMREIAQKLESYRDPETGGRPVLRAALSKDIYSGEGLHLAPDIIVGYNSGYRVSWATPLGRVPKNILEDNTQKWSGDHCMSPTVVPAILLSNKRSKIIDPKLQDLAPTILAEFGLPVPEDMIGQPLFQ